MCVLPQKKKEEGSAILKRKRKKAEGSAPCKDSRASPASRTCCYYSERWNRKVSGIIITIFNQRTAHIVFSRGYCTYCWVCNLAFNMPAKRVTIELVSSGGILANLRFPMSAQYGPDIANTLEVPKRTKQKIRPFFSFRKKHP